MQLKQIQLTMPLCPFSSGTWCEAEGDTHVNAGLAGNGYLSGTETRANEWSHEPFQSLSSAHPMLTQLSIPQHTPHFFPVILVYHLQMRPRVQSKIYLCKVWNSEKAWSIIRYRHIWTIWACHLNCCAVLMFVTSYNVQRRN